MWTDGSSARTGHAHRCSYAGESFRTARAGRGPRMPSGRELGQVGQEAVAVWTRAVRAPGGPGLVFHQSCRSHPDRPSEGTASLSALSCRQAHPARRQRSWWRDAPHEGTLPEGGRGGRRPLSLQHPDPRRHSRGRGRTRPGAPGWAVRRARGLRAGPRLCCSLSRWVGWGPSLGWTSALPAPLPSGPTSPGGLTGRRHCCPETGKDTGWVSGPPACTAAQAQAPLPPAGLSTGRLCGFGEAWGRGLGQLAVPAFALFSPLQGAFEKFFIKKKFFYCGGSYMM